MQGAREGFLVKRTVQVKKNGEALLAQSVLGFSSVQIFSRQTQEKTRRFSWTVV